MLMLLSMILLLIEDHDDADVVEILMRPSQPGGTQSHGFDYFFIFMHSGIERKLEAILRNNAITTIEIGIGSFHEIAQRKIQFPQNQAEKFMLCTHHTGCLQ